MPRRSREGTKRVFRAPLNTELLLLNRNPSLAVSVGLFKRSPLDIYAYGRAEFALRRRLTRGVKTLDLLRDEFRLYYERLEHDFFTLCIRLIMVLVLWCGNGLLRLILWLSVNSQISDGFYFLQD